MSFFSKLEKIIFYYLEFFFQNKTLINEGIEILKNWKKTDEKFMETLKRVYAEFARELQKAPNQRIMDIAPGVFDEKLSNLLLERIGMEGLRQLCIYILDNVRWPVSIDGINNYLCLKPFPPHLVFFIYGFLYFLELPDFRDRRLFISFWEYQARTRRGVDEQYTLQFFNPFIKQGITTKDEIRQLCISDWLRWQEAPEDSPYYGAPLGATIWYFEYKWESVEKKLQDEWRKRTGKEPKEWGL